MKTVHAYLPAIVLACIIGLVLPKQSQRIEKLETTTGQFHVEMGANIATVANRVDSLQQAIDTVAGNTQKVFAAVSVEKPPLQSSSKEILEDPAFWGKMKEVVSTVCKPADLKATELTKFSPQGRTLKRVVYSKYSDKSCIKCEEFVKDVAPKIRELGVEVVERGHLPDGKTASPLVSLVYSDSTEQALPPGQSVTLAQIESMVKEGGPEYNPLANDFTFFNVTPKFMEVLKADPAESMKFSRVVQSALQAGLCVLCPGVEASLDSRTGRLSFAVQRQAVVHRGAMVCDKDGCMSVNVTVSGPEPSVKHNLITIECLEPRHCDDCERAIKDIVPSYQKSGWRVDLSKSDRGGLYPIITVWQNGTPKEFRGYSSLNDFHAKVRSTLR